MNITLFQKYFYLFFIIINFHYNPLFNTGYSVQKCPSQAVSVLYRFLIFILNITLFQKYFYLYFIIINYYYNPLFNTGYKVLLKNLFWSVHLKQCPYCTGFFSFFFVVNITLFQKYFYLFFIIINFHYNPLFNTGYSVQKCPSQAVSVLYRFLIFILNITLFQKYFYLYFIIINYYYNPLFNTGYKVLLKNLFWSVPLKQCPYCTGFFLLCF